MNFLVGHRSNCRIPSITRVVIALLSMPTHVFGFNNPSHENRFLNRREALGTAASLLTTLTLPAGNARAESEGGVLLLTNANEEFKAATVKNDDFKAYSIIPDASASLSPELIALEKAPFLKKLAAGDNSKGGALWLGEHHNSVKDHTLQANIIESIYDERKSLQGSPGAAPLAIGLEQVQLQFQGSLDDFVAGKISLEEMKKQVDWEKRWFWPFDGYAHIFERARELNIPLLALNVNSEDLAQVELAGLPGLSQDRLKQYIKDPQGFAVFAQQRDFRDYVEYVIAPSYEVHERMGLLKTTISGLRLEENMSFRNFFSGRILWDESMASNAHSWVESNPGGLIIGLVGADHVKFRNGIPGRFSRMGGDSLSCTSVLLNPTLIDTRPSGSVSDVVDAASSQYPDRITLQLRYLKDGVDKQNPEARQLPDSTGGVLPLADYIVVT